MKILLTLDFPPEIGGIQKYLYNIVKHCYDDKDIVLAGCSVSPSVSQKPLLKTQVEYVSTFLSKYNKKFSLIAIFYKLLRILPKHTKNLKLECANIYAAIAPWLLSFFCSIEYNVYVYGTELLSSRKQLLLSAIKKNILSRAASIYATSMYTKSLVEKLGIRKKVDILPCKIELPAINFDRIYHIRCNKADFQILCVARFVKHKGHVYLLEAVGNLPDSIPWSLVLAGDGPLFGYLRKKYAKQSWTSRVRFAVGLTDIELEKLYMSADVFVLPSISTSTGTEGFGIVLLEAMAFKIPIIASDTGGIREVLDNGKCGILVKAASPMAITEAIINIYNKTELKLELVENAYKRLLKHYVW